MFPRTSGNNLISIWALSNRQTEPSGVDLCPFSYFRLFFYLRGIAGQAMRPKRRAIHPALRNVCLNIWTFIDIHPRGAWLSNKGGYVHSIFRTWTKLERLYDDDDGKPLRQKFGQRTLASY